MYMHMYFKLCVYATKAQGGEYFDINIVSKGTLLVIFMHD